MLKEGKQGMGNSNIRTYLFMASITLVSSLLLSYSYSALKEISENNEKFDKKRNIIKSVGADISVMSKEEIIDNYKQNVKEIILDDNYNPVSNVLWEELVAIEDKKNGITYFINKKDKINFNPNDESKFNSVQKYLPLFFHSRQEVFVFPISGKGLWSTLFGFLALDKDKNTVKGITFYKHKETPGLGGEVDKEWFQKNFIGKKIFNKKNDLVSVKVVKGKSSALSSEQQVHAVDGITGATITSKGVSDFLLRDLLRYEGFLRD